MTTFPRTAPRRAPRTLRPLLALGAALPLVLALTAASVHAQTTTASTVPNGRLLASNCFQCHGTNGKGGGFDALVGQSVNEIYKKLVEFRSGKEDNALMTKHAMGYTDAQMRALSAWLSTQR